jgi:proteasome regulatory subunit
MHISDVDLGAIAAVTEDFTGAELEAVCREAGMIAVRQEADFISMNNFMDAVRKVKNETVADNRMYT